MAYIEKGLRRVSHGGVVNPGSAGINSVWSYFTNDAAAAVEAANYFDAAAPRLAAGDVIIASLDLDGTPTLKNYIVTARTATSVTIAAQTTT